MTELSGCARSCSAIETHRSLLGSDRTLAVRLGIDTSDVPTLTAHALLRWALQDDA